MANGNEILQQVIGVQTNGQPSGQTQSLTLTQLTNFEGSTTIATSQSVTTSTTLVSSGMSVNLISGATYVFDLYVTVTNGSSGGLKLAFGGTATATTFSADTWAYNSTTLAAQGVITSLASNLVAYTGSVTTVSITGSILCAASGTFNLSFAQNVSNATATTLNAGSNFWIDRVS